MGKALQPTGGAGTGGYAATYSSPTSIDTACSVQCNMGPFNYFGKICGVDSPPLSTNLSALGTVNSQGSTTAGDCYCGNVLTFITIAGLGNGMALETACGSCNVGLGQCGVSHYIPGDQCY